MADEGMQDVQTMQEALEAARAEAKAARLEAARIKVATRWRLPEGLAARLRGEDEAALEADARDLVRYLPRASLANPAGEATLTLEEISQMAPEEINRRWDDVRRVLGKGR